MLQKRSKRARNQRNANREDTQKGFCIKMHLFSFHILFLYAICATFQVNLLLCFSSASFPLHILLLLCTQQNQKPRSYEFYNKHKQYSFFLFRSISFIDSFSLTTLGKINSKYFYFFFVVELYQCFRFSRYSSFQLLFTCNCVLSGVRNFNLCYETHKHLYVSVHIHTRAHIQSKWYCGRSKKLNRKKNRERGMVCVHISFFFSVKDNVIVIKLLKESVLALACRFAYVSIYLFQFVFICLSFKPKKEFKIIIFVMVLSFRL